MSWFSFPFFFFFQTLVKLACVFIFHVFVFSQENRLELGCEVRYIVLKARPYCTSAYLFKMPLYKWLVLLICVVPLIIVDTVAETV